jgi:SAM-dependent methyltransferase
LSPEPEPPALEALRRRADEEDAAYAEVLAALDRLSSFALPAEAAPEVRERLERLNALWPAPERPRGGGLGGALRGRAWDALAPAVERQVAFNAALVQLLNAYLGQADALNARLRELAGALVRYAQRVQPLVDARDRVAAGLATTRSELVLEAFDRRLESLGRRLEGLLALRDRLKADDDSVHTALESRRRGSADEIAGRLGEHADRFAESGPVVDLGCGRGELLRVLRERGIPARGVETNADAARQCREAGLDVAEGDLVDFLRAQAEGSLGGVFSARAVEHLPPPALAAMLAESHRALRPGGLLLLEAFHRDPTREGTLHPEMLSFLVAAAGFPEVRVEMRAPVPAADQLRPVPAEGLPPPVAAALNENVGRLNTLLYGCLDYVLVARR